MCAQKCKTVTNQYFGICLYQGQKKNNERTNKHEHLSGRDLLVITSEVYDALLARRVD